MQKVWARIGITAMLAVGLVSWSGCPGMGGGGGNQNDNDNGNSNDNGNGNTNGNDNGGGGGGQVGGFNFVLTGVPIHVQGRIEVGDDIIAYTDIDPDRTPGAPNYIVPSAGDTAGRGIPNATDFDPDSFKVSGKKIIMTGSASSDRVFGVTVFDTTDNSIAEVPIEDVRLTNIPIGNYSPGFFEVDGNYVVTRNDTDDDIIVKVVDITNATPEVIEFSVNPSGATPFSVSMVAVDAETRTVVAATSSMFAVYDIDNPNNPPTEFDVTNFGGVDDIPMAYDNGMLLYVENTSDAIVHLLDTSNGANMPQTVTTPRSGTNRLILRGDNYGFIYQAAASMGPTAAIGVLPNLNPNVSDGETVFASSANGGRFGFGDTLAVAANGSTTWFLGGIDNIGFVDPFQSSSDGTSWSVVPDPRDPDVNLAVGDVVTNVDGSLLGFKHEVDDDQFVGYVILN